MSMSETSEVWAPIPLGGSLRKLLESGADVATRSTDDTLTRILEHTTEEKVKGEMKKIKQMTIILAADRTAMNRILQDVQKIPHAGKICIVEETDGKYTLSEAPDVVIGTPHDITSVFDLRLLDVADVRFLIFDDLDEILNRLAYTWAVMKIGKLVKVSESGVQIVYIYPEFSTPVATTVLRASPGVLWHSADVPEALAEAHDGTISTTTGGTRATHHSLYSTSLRTQQRLTDCPVGKKLGNRHSFNVAETTAYAWLEGQSCAIWSDDGYMVLRERQLGWIQATIKEVQAGGAVVVRFRKPRSGAVIAEEERVQTGNIDRIRHVLSPASEFEKELDITLRSYLAVAQNRRTAKRRKTGDAAKGPSISDLTLVVDAHIALLVTDQRPDTPFRVKDSQGRNVSKNGRWVVDWTSVMTHFHTTHPMEYGMLLEKKGSDLAIQNYFRKKRYPKLEFVRQFQMAVDQSDV